MFVRTTAQVRFWYMDMDTFILSFVSFFSFHVVGEDVPDLSFFFLAFFKLHKQTDWSRFFVA